MYNDTIKAANRIITYEDLLDIFAKMHEKIEYYKKISINEEEKNKMLNLSYQNWTFKDSNSKLKFDVDFYDDTNVSFDNYASFITVFNNRINEIKRINVAFSMYYSVQPQGGKSEFYSQSIHLYISENKINIDIKLSNEDKKIDDVYEFIKNKILYAPEKYDNIVKNRKNIITIVGISIGFIPAIIIATLLLFVPTIREVLSGSFVLFPIVSMFLTIFFGQVIGASKFGDLYKNIVPNKKYAGYDHGAIYKDDIDEYYGTGEILIGKNYDNLKCRKKIQEIYDKYKKYIKYELGVLIILSLLVLIF